MCAAILSRKAGRPVRINFSREEVYWINRGRHPSYIEVKMTADEEARISGFDIDALIDGGGFASFGHVTSYYNGVLATAPYELGSFHYTGAAYGQTNQQAVLCVDTGLSIPAVQLKLVSMKWLNKCKLILSTYVWRICFLHIAEPSLVSASPQTDA